MKRLKKECLFFLIIGCLFIVSFLVCSAQTQEWPTRPIRIVVAYSAGGGTDRAARLLQPYLEKEIGESVIIENLPGAGGQVAATSVYRRKPDGYTILAINQPHLNVSIALGNAVYKNDDFIPFWVEVISPVVAIVMNDSPWNNFVDFIEAARDNPGRYAISGTQMSGQVGIPLYIADKLGLDINIVSYGGGAPAAAALLGGHVDMCFGDALGRYDLRDEVKALGIASVEPCSLWPEAKHFNEQLKQYNVQLPSPTFLIRYGLYAVRKEFKEEYPERYEKLVQSFKAATKNEEYLATTKKIGMEPILVFESDPEKYQEIFSKDYDALVRDLLPLIGK